VFVIYPANNAPPVLRANEYIGIQPHELLKLVQPKWKSRLNKLVALAPVTIRNKKEFNLNKILAAMDRNVVLSKLTETMHCRESEKMLKAGALNALYKDYPMLVRNTGHLLDQCAFEFDFKAKRNKKYYTQGKEEDEQLLEKLTMEGMRRIYGEDHPIALARIQKELKIISEMNFAGYFLINWDIVQYSNQQGLAHVGRGSGANSIVSYCLGITAICPIELNLYFERFLNPGRSSPPDFDIDWSWQDRDKILAYIFERFGKENVAFCGTIGQFKYRSIIRELGKVFGLAKEEMDFMIRTRDEEHTANSVTRLVYEYGKMLEGYPNMRSMHACGIIISEEPITNFTALEMPPKGFAIVQFDMHIAEDVGFDKFDILSQRGLGSIYDCVKLLKKNRGITVNIDNIALSKNEARANELLKHGNTIGCFYVESPAMRGLLRKLKCDSFPVLVAASSIIRPGVAESGMMGEYVFRHNNPDKFRYFHPVFEEQLSDTYGLMVYQEDVIKIAHHFAKLDLKDADILRRGMSGKTRSRKEFEGVRDRFFLNCEKMGYPDELTKEVFRQIESFAGFSFCKAHSASYAIESYQSLYLKINYPVEHIVAVINNFGGFYRTEVYIHEARMAGATIHLPCVNKGAYLTGLYGKDVYLGFVLVKALPSEISEKISVEREGNGVFSSLEDFINRVPAGIETIQLLIFSGAFRFTGKSKHELTLMARLYFNRAKKMVRSHTLFDEPVKNYRLPEVMRSPFEDAFDEIELFGFPVSISPFDLLKTRHRGKIFATDLAGMNRQVVKMLAYLVAIKDVPTRNGNLNFGTWIDAEGNYFDTTHFADSLARYPFQGAGCYLMQGRVEVEFGFPGIVVTRMEKLPFIPDPRYENDEERSYRTLSNMRPDLSMTHRAPYPTADESGLPRMPMGTEGQDIGLKIRHFKQGERQFSLGGR
jgi:DNA polymerase-3 subunit alpha/error-prone DNA polymerase